MVEIGLILRMLRSLREVEEGAALARDVDLGGLENAEELSTQPISRLGQADSQNTQVPPEPLDHPDLLSATSSDSGVARDGLANFQQVRERQLAEQDEDEGDSQVEPTDSSPIAAHLRSVRRRRGGEEGESVFDASQLRGRFEMQNFQAASLGNAAVGGDSSGSTQSKGAGEDLPQVSKQLADAASKMDKAFSHGRTVMVVGD